MQLIITNNNFSNLTLALPRFFLVPKGWTKPVKIELIKLNTKLNTTKFLQFNQKHDIFFKKKQVMNNHFAIKGNFMTLANDFKLIYYMQL